MPKFVEDIL
jgi:hypothetical protein